MTVRFCLVCGTRLTSVVAEGHRRRRCPGCGWTFYDNPVPASTAIVIVGGRLLLGRRARPPYAGTWDLPGGFLEAGETPPAALRRELREELHVGIRRASLIGFATDTYGPRGFAVLSIVYRVTPTSHRMTPADDVSELHWFNLDEVPFKQIAFVGVRHLLRRYLKATSGKEMTAFERGLCPRNPDLGGGSARAGREARSARRKGGEAPLRAMDRIRQARAGSC